MRLPCPTYKLCAVGADLTPVAKLSPSGKHSLPGPIGMRAAGEPGPTVFAANKADISGSRPLVRCLIWRSQTNWTRSGPSGVDAPPRQHKPPWIGALRSGEEMQCANLRREGP
jgi:hypothetical protein